jgi:hypothetical protein
MPTANPHQAPQDQAQLDTLIRAFEDGSLPKPQWTHAAHLIAGAHYVHALGFDRALTAMRTNVRAYNQAVGTANTDTSGYHETLTRMWLLVLAHLKDQHATLSELALAQLAVERYGHRSSLHRDLYRTGIAKSTRARKEWLEPDTPIETLTRPSQT